MTSSHKKALTALKRELGQAVVSTSSEACFAASWDSSRLSFLPHAVVHPRHEQEIATLLKLANTYRVPVTTRGGGSATTGATVPRHGGWVVDLSHWQKTHLDSVSGLAYVQPGVRTAAIQKAAEKRGWFYPPDPSSQRDCTIGGNIATNAGGMHGAKYGVTRDYVYALEGFLPSGDYVRWAADLKKFASGYNIRDLWIGSEGTLGIITGAVLKLIPKPLARQTCLAAFKNEGDALRAVKALLKERILPSILEFLDRQTVDCTEGLPGPSVFPPGSGRALLLIELDGHPAQVAEEMETVLLWAEKRALDFHKATTEEEAEALWKIRRHCSQAMFQMGDTKLNEDVVVPLKSQIPLLRFTRQLRRETGLATPTFGHAADGNFHVHVMYNRKDKEQTRRAAQAIRALMEKVIALGGAITGEHGIGLTKTPFMSLQHSRAEIEMMRALKRTFDPHNILNPGKIFDRFEVWQHSPLDLRLPWDP